MKSTCAVRAASPVAAGSLYVASLLPDFGLCLLLLLLASENAD
jgi:hypothetical protein